MHAHTHSQDVKVLKTLTRIVDEWVRSRLEAPLYSLPSLREVSQLVTRMMVFFEKRFPEETELITQFLEIVLYIYRCGGCGVCVRILCKAPPTSCPSHEVCYSTHQRLYTCTIHAISPSPLSLPPSLSPSLPPLPPPSSLSLPPSLLSLSLSIPPSLSPGVSH